MNRLRSKPGFPTPIYKASPAHALPTSFGLIAFVAVLLFSPSGEILRAQNDVDALRYSMLDFGSSARAAGVGGAFGALGGDFGGLSINPAGLGVYRSSEVSFGPAFQFSQQSANYYGQSAVESRGSLGVGSAGLVLTSHNDELRRAGSLNRVSSSLAFGVNRLADYHGTLRYRGENPNSSLLNTWSGFLNQGNVAQADAYDSDPFGAGLAWEAYLINPQPGDSTAYQSVLPFGGAEQERLVETRGALNELLFGYGVNLGNKLYIGATIGVPILRYTETSTWTERDAAGSIAGFDSYAYRQSLRTTGSGLNAKLGLIARPQDNIRLGVSVHSPTRFRLTDAYRSEITSDVDTAGYEAFSPEGLFTYNLSTPWRVVGSAGFLWKSVGFFSLDYEFLDYGFSRYNFRGFADGRENNTNDLIADKYRSTHVLRAGAEFKVSDWRLRAGYAWRASPFSADQVPDAFDQSQQQLSAGLGYRGEFVYIDLAYTHALSSFQNVPYLPLDPGVEAPVAEVDAVDGTASLTFGFRF